MATSQSSFPSSHASQIQYDVFISFRGSDTRRGFLSHLLYVLTQKNIEVYVDNKLREGDELLPALFTAIEESQIALIILSEDYASSKWCLEELVKITECMMKKGQIVVPIFYKVDPSEVRHQKGCYKNAFDEHEKLLKDNIMNVEKWRAALKKVANLSGFHSINFGFEDVSLHDLIREMGREIVREQSIKNPGERSHLWDSDDICHVLENDKGTEHIESISLNMTRPGDLSISPHAFARMTNLKLLRIHNSHTHSRVHLPKGLRILPDKIRLFHWDNYPCKSFQTTLNVEYLVELRMPNSRVKELWNGAPNLPNLKRIDLAGSKQLIEVPDFSKATSLETVFLFGCANLISIHPSIFTLQKLVWVDLMFCRRLENLPAIEALPSSVRRCVKLQHLDSFACGSLEHLQRMSKHILYSLFFVRLNSLTHQTCTCCSMTYGLQNVYY